MTDDREIRDYLEDIVDTSEKLAAFIEDQTFDTFRENDEKVFAVIRALEVIGEAAKSIPEEVRAKHPDIPWRKMTGMRDVLAHHYFGVQLELVWHTARNDVPEVSNSIAKLLADLGSAN